MLFLYSLLLSLVLFLLCHKWIKKFPVVFYLLTVLFIVFLFTTYFLGYYEQWPSWFLYFATMFSRGALSTAVFVIVMYLGVLNRKIPGYTKLKGIRGEISIIGSILALGHNIYYGIYYFVHIFTNPQELELPYLIATIISLILILIMLPLMITSFLCVRRRMEAKKWKKLQTLAYPFYFLLYVHIMIVLVSNIRGTVTIVNIIVYSVVFLSYFMLLGNKLLKKRKVVIH